MTEAEEERLKAALQIIEHVQSLNPAELPRVEELGFIMSFTEAVEAATKTVEIFKMLGADSLTGLPLPRLEEIRHAAQRFSDWFANVRQFSPANFNNPGQDRQALLDEGRDIYGVVLAAASHVALLAALSDDGIAATQQRLRGVIASITTAEGEVKTLLTSVKAAAAQTGVTQQASYFHAEARNHGSEAMKWGKATAFMAVLFVLAAGGALFMHKVPLLAPTNDYETIQLVVGKVLAFGVLGYSLVLCAKNFLSHKHNQVVNTHRSNALLTFEALAGAAGSEDKRDIILTYAASCIFSPQKTGYIRPSGSNDSTQAKLIEVFPKVIGGGQG